MTTPLTTAEIVERLTTDSDLLDAWATWELGALPVPGPMNHADIATNLRTAASALLALEGERDEAHRHAKALTKALVGLTPGGSEYFTRSTLLDDYFADIETCTAVIRERFDSGHKAKLERVDERRRAEAAEAELAKVREALEPFAKLAEGEPDTVMLRTDSKEFRRARAALSEKTV